MSGFEVWKGQAVALGLTGNDIGQYVVTQQNAEREERQREREARQKERGTSERERERNARKRELEEREKERVRIS